MSASYTRDVFSTLDGYGSYSPDGIDWGGYWSKQGPELLEHRASQFEDEQQLVFDWPDAIIVREDAATVVARMKQGSDVPIRSQASLSFNWSMLAAGLVDRVQVTIFPVITRSNGISPIFGGTVDFDLELLDARTLDGNTQQLTYRPTAR